MYYQILHPAKAEFLIRHIYNLKKKEQKKTKNKRKKHLYRGGGGTKLSLLLSYIYQRDLFDFYCIEKKWESAGLIDHYEFKLSVSSAVLNIITM